MSPIQTSVSHFHFLPSTVKGPAISVVGTIALCTADSKELCIAPLCLAYCGLLDFATAYSLIFSSHLD